MKYLKYLLFLFIIFITPNVFAYDYDVTNIITAPTGPSTAGHYLGLEIYNTGLQNNYTVNTRYNGTLSEIIFNLPLPSTAGQCFTTNMDYTVTMEMATQDWRNHFATPFVSWYSGGTNWKSSNVTFVSMKKIYFKFKIPSTETSCTDFVYVRLRSPSVSSTAFTGATNWNLSKITLTDGYSSSGGSGGSGGSGSTDATNQNVIDNANENTQDIIDNANENTQKIVDQQAISNQCSMTNIITGSMCHNISGSNDIECRVPIYSGVKYHVDVNGYAWARARIYDSNDTWLGTFGSVSSSIKVFDFTAFNGSNYALFTFYPGNGVEASSIDYSKITFKCLTKQDEINTSITNPNIDNGVGSDFFNNFSSQDFGLSQIITLPLATIQSLANTSCVSLNIPIPFTNSTIPLPCMTQVYQTYIPTIFNIWQVVSFGIIAYFICIDIVHLVKGFKDPDSDKVEVLDL